MAIGLRMVGDKLRCMPDFPPQLRTLVEHMILSHHGKLEFGSPKLPQFPEALLLHYLDDMDSKMECMRALVEKDRQVNGCFTGYNVSLERTVLKKAKYMSTAAANGGHPVAKAAVAADAIEADAAEFAEPEAPKVAPHRFLRWFPMTQGIRCLQPRRHKVHRGPGRGAARITATPGAALPESAVDAWRRQCA